MKRSRERKSQEIDLNIVPIVDFLTIVLCFMLASGSYVAIAALSVSTGTPSLSTSNSQGDEPEVTVSISLHNNRSLLLELGGKSPKATTFQSKKNDWDYGALKQALVEVKKRWPKVKTATLKADQQVIYQEVVSAMEHIRKTHPNITLGGF